MNGRGLVSVTGIHHFMNTQAITPYAHIKVKRAPSCYPISHFNTPPIPPGAFKVLCKFILKKQFIIDFKVIFDNLVISNFFARI